MTFSYFLEKHQNKFVLFLLLCAITPYLYLSFFAHPAADDFTYAHKGLSSNFFRTWLGEYFTWNGRYFSNILVLLNPISHNCIFVYRLIPILLLLFTFISLYKLISVISETIASKTSISIYSLFVLLIYLNCMPIISEGIYWYTASVTYHLANILCLIYFNTLFSFYKKNYIINKSIHFLLNSIILISIAGFNEVIMIIMLLFHCIILTPSIQKKQLSLSKLGYLLIIITASCFVIFSPGNEIRESNFSEKHQLFHSIYMSFLQIIRFSSKWILNPGILFTSLLFIPISSILSKNSKLFNNNFHLHPFIISLLPFLVLFICIFPAYWSTGIMGQHRTVNVACFFFIILWFMNLHVWITNFKRKNKTISLSKTLVVISFFTAYIGIVFTGNGYFSLTDIIQNKASKFNIELENRYRMIKECKHNGSSSCIVPALTSQPKSLFVLDITEDHTHWINEGYMIFYEMKDVRLILEKPD